MIGQNITNKAECLQYEDNRWINQKYNFDNLGGALKSLFVLSSKDGWVDIMYHGLDAVGIDQQVGLKCLTASIVTSAISAADLSIKQNQ